MNEQVTLQQVREEIARVFDMLAAQPRSSANVCFHCSDARAVVARLCQPKPVARRVVTFTQIGERVPMEDDWCEIGLTGQFIPGSDVASRKQSRPVFRRDESCTTAVADCADEAP